MDISLGSLIFSLLALFLLFNGINTLIKNKRIKKNGIKAVGVIIDFNIKTDKDPERGTKISKYPIIEFKNRKGERITSELTQSDNQYMIGNNIPIIYLKNGNNYNIVIDSKLWLINFPLGMTIIGLFVLLITIIITFKL